MQCREGNSEALLQFCRIGDDAKKLEGFSEGILELVKVARPDIKALTLRDLMLHALLIHGEALSALYLDYMLVIMVVKRRVASRCNKEVAHDYVA